MQHDEQLFTLRAQPYHTHTRARTRIRTLACPHTDAQTHTSTTITLSITAGRCVSSCPVRYLVSGSRLRLRLDFRRWLYLRVYQKKSRRRRCRPLAQRRHLLIHSTIPVHLSFSQAFAGAEQG